MNLPIEFPTDADVIAEESARFRRLAPDVQAREVCEMVRVYYFLLDRSPIREKIVQIAEEEENRGRRAIEQFAARHG